jgi:aminomethyltransferase
VSAQTEAQVRAVRNFAGLAEMNTRGLIQVRGADRARWLNGMVSNEVEALKEGPRGSGCYAALLTPKGRVVADLHILLRPDAFWLETLRSEVAQVLERLERYIIADDVELREISDDFEQLGLEGPEAMVLLEAAADARVELAREACVDLVIADIPVVVAAFGWTGEPAVQIFVPTGRGAAVARRLAQVAGGSRLMRVADEALEILRIEAGTPMLGFELDEEVLPDEARLEHAISIVKGCYTGQEIIARLRSRGHVNHLLVGLRFSTAAVPPRDTELFVDGRRTGEVTSACISPNAGAIGLGYVRTVHAEPGQELALLDERAVVAPLPIWQSDAGEGGTQRDGEQAR